MLKKALASDNLLQGLVIGHHAYHHATFGDRLARLTRQSSSLGRQDICFAQGTIKNGKEIACLEKAVCHSLSHIAKANKANHFAHHSSSVTIMRSISDSTRSHCC